MKIIDLLNKIANGEEVPKKIKYLYYEYEFNEEEKEYQRLQNEIIYGLGEDRRLDIVLDDEVEIIEENKTKSLTKKDIETLGYACGEIQKCFTNGWTKSLENKPLEEHKIPEKLEICYSPDIEEEIFYEKGNKPNHYVLGDVGTKLIINKINEILDYLEKIK